MGMVTKFIVSALLAAAALSAQPSIKLVQNNYGWMLPGMPNYGIAQGSIFTITGTNLGPDSLVLTAGYPLQTTLSGVTVQVTVGAQILAVPLYYAWKNAVSGVLPSVTPVGFGTVTLTYNNQTASAPIEVVTRAFGMLALNGGGSGAAVAQNVTQSGTNPPLAALSNAVHPGETLVLYGSGLGASSNDTQLVNPVENWKDTIPVQVWVGSEQATVTYAGRSGQYPGLDQINIAVPPGTSGCYVSVYVKTGSADSAIVSNTGTIPILSQTRACSDPNGLRASDVDALATGTYRLGFVNLNRTSNNVNFGSFSPQQITDTGSAVFTRYTAEKSTTETAVNPFRFPSVGSCVVLTGNGGFDSSSLALALDVPEARKPGSFGEGLDAGPQIAVTGPKGTKNLTPPAGEKGFYMATLSGAPGTPQAGQTFLDAADYSVVGTGGADVGALNVMLHVATPLTWTNKDLLGNLDRHSDVTLTWTGADPGSEIIIQGVSVAEAVADNPPFGVFLCTSLDTAPSRFRPASLWLCPSQSQDS